MNKLNELLNRQKFFRRLVLVWVLVVITDFYLFIKNYEFLLAITPAGVSVTLGIFGMLATIIGFYQWHRKADDDMAERERKRLESSDGK